MATYKGEDPNKPAPPPKGTAMSSAGYFPASSQSGTARNLDVRDIIAGFIGRGDKDLTNENARKDFAYLQAQLGQDVARKVLNHIVIFNQQPGRLSDPFEKRLQSLYDIGSKDKDVDALLKRTGMLEQGVIPGARTSANVNVMQAERGGLVNPSTPLVASR